MPSLKRLAIGFGAFIAMRGACMFRDCARGPIPRATPARLSGLYVDTNGKSQHYRLDLTKHGMKIRPVGADRYWAGVLHLAGGDFYLSKGDCYGTACKGRTTCSTGIFGFGPEKMCTYETLSVECHGRRTAPHEDDRDAPLTYQVSCSLRDYVAGECWCYGRGGTAEYENNRVKAKRYSRHMTLRKL
ncbi:hypothetical protein ACFL6C_04045 [Myxococcota bacterium]